MITFFASKELRIALVFGVLLTTATPLRAVTLEFELSAAPDDTYNSLNVAVQPGGFGSDTQGSDVNGLLVTDLGLQVGGSDVVVTELTLHEKSLEPDQRLLDFSDVHFTYSLLGEVIFTIDGTGLGGSMIADEDSPNSPPSTVTNGQFDAAEQQLTIDRGFFVPSVGPPQDMSEDPFPFFGTSSGTGTIDLVETSRVGSRVTYDVTLTVPVQVEDTIVMSITVIMQVDGTLQGSTQWTFYGADFDHDLDVDGADFLIWQRGVGLPGEATQQEGDANLDTHVNELDLAAWQDQFGTSPTASVSTVTNIPEPGTVVLALIIGSLLVLPRRSIH
jgi:hypothetical protein